MRLGLPALAAGLLALRFLAELPSVGWLLGMAAAGLLLLFGRLYWLGLFLLGFAWACGSAQVALDGRLAAELDGRTLWLEGRVVDLPASGEGVTRFRLEEVSAARGVLLPERLRLSWRGAPPLMGGERWRLAVTLKRPRGLVNAAGFDYEAWLLAQRVGAVGTVKAGQRLQPASGLDAWRDAWRQRLLAVDAQGRGAALAALVLGDGSGLSAAEWRMFQDTGTVHLMVISGSHISLLAGMLYGLVAALHRLGCWPRRLPWLPCACALGLLGAWSYGLMAGFEVPVRRACLMVSLALVWRLRFRHLGLLTPLLATLVLVLLVEPLASLQAGFWLSFLAVALLLWLFAGRLGRWRWWAAWGRAQWGMALGLAMPLLALGLPLSLSGAPANLLAVPWIELLVVPPGPGGEPAAVGARAGRGAASRRWRFAGPAVSCAWPAGGPGRGLAATRRSGLERSAGHARRALLAGAGWLAVACPRCRVATAGIVAVIAACRMGAGGSAGAGRRPGAGRAGAYPRACLAL